MHQWRRGCPGGLKNPTTAAGVHPVPTASIWKLRSGTLHPLMQSSPGLRRNQKSHIVTAERSLFGGHALSRIASCAHDAPSSANQNRRSQPSSSAYSRSCRSFFPSFSSIISQSTPTAIAPTPSTGTGTGATGESGKRIDRAPDLRPQPPELHAPPPQLRRELRRPRRSPRAESPHERGGVEFGGEDARVQVRV